MTALSTIDNAIYNQDYKHNAYGGDTNSDPNSIIASPIGGMQWRSTLNKEDPNTRQWAENTFGEISHTHTDPAGATLYMRVVFEFFLHDDFILPDSGNLDKFCTLHSGGEGGGNYFRIYVNSAGNYQWLAQLETDDTGTSVFSHSNIPILRNFRNVFELRLQMPRDTSSGWVEIALNDRLTGSATPMTDQFLPRTTLKATGTSGLSPYIQLGMDTRPDGMPAATPTGTAQFWDMSLISCLKGSF